MEGSAKRHTASYHTDVDVVAISLQIDAQASRRKRKVGSDVGKLVCGRELRVDHGSRVHHPGVSERSAAIVAEARISGSVNVVRRRVVRLVPVALECPKHCAMAGTMYIVELANPL